MVSSKQARIVRVPFGFVGGGGQWHAEVTHGLGEQCIVVQVYHQEEKQWIPEKEFSFTVTDENRIVIRSGQRFGALGSPNPTDSKWSAVIVG